MERLTDDIGEDIDPLTGNFRDPTDNVEVLTPEEIEQVKREIDSLLSDEFFEGWFAEVDEAWAQYPNFLEESEVEDPDYLDKISYISAQQHKSFIAAIRNHLGYANAENVLPMLEQGRELSDDDAQEIANGITAPASRIFLNHAGENVSLEEYLNEYYSFIPDIQISVTFAGHDLRDSERMQVYRDHKTTIYGHEKVQEMIAGRRPEFYEEAIKYFDEMAMPILEVNYKGRSYRAVIIGTPSPYYRKGDKRVEGTSSREPGQIGTITIACDTDFAKSMNFPGRIRVMIHEVDHFVKSIFSTEGSKKRDSADSMVREACADRAGADFERRHVELPTYSLYSALENRYILSQKEDDVGSHSTGELLQEVLLKYPDIYKKMFLYREKSEESEVPAEIRQHIIQISRDKAREIEEQFNRIFGFEEETGAN